MVFNSMLPIISLNINSIDTAIKRYCHIGHKSKIKPCFLTILLNYTDILR